MNSDYLAILLRLRRMNHRRVRGNQKRFRFEAMWLKSEDCGRIVSENWEADRDSLSNLESCRVGLVNWDKVVFGSVRRKVSELKKGAGRFTQTADVDSSER